MNRNMEGLCVNKGEGSIVIVVEYESRNDNRGGEPLVTAS